MNENTVETPKGKYAIKFVDLPLCEFRFGRFLVTQKDGKNIASAIMACGRKKYIKITALDCLECALNC